MKSLTHNAASPVSAERCMHVPDWGESPTACCAPCPASSLTPLGLTEMFRIVTMTISLVAPIRFAIVWILLILGSFIARGVLPSPIDDRVSKLVKLRHHVCLTIVRYGARGVMFAAGFHYVPVRGKWDKRARILVATHHSIWDSLWLLYNTGASQAAKSELFQMPIIGDYLKAVSSMSIDRRSRKDRKLALAELRRRAHDMRYPPILVFPTACCTNCRQLTRFKLGAFAAGVPVQPVGIAYPARNYDLKMGVNPLWDMYRTVCQNVNYMTVTFLPIQIPPDEDIRDPVSWARKVWTEMGKSLGMQLIDNYRYETELLRIRCRKHNIPFNELILSNSIHLPLLEAIIDSFVKLDRDRDGWIGYSDIVAALPVEVEFDQKHSDAICELIKRTTIPPENYSSQRSWSNSESWVEKGLVGLVTGGRPKLNPRSVDESYPTKLEVAEIMEYFQNMHDGCLPRNLFMIELFGLHDFFTQ